MPRSETIRVPDIGDFEDVDVIEVLVSPGDRVEAEQSLITLESDKATLEIPSPRAGEVEALRVSVGDKVSEGDEILVLRVAAEAADEDEEGDEGEEEQADERERRPAAEPEAERAEAAPEGEEDEAPERETEEAPEPRPAGAAGRALPRRGDVHAEVVVLGAGPGGYTAAFRAADLGKEVALVERHAKLGGVCLHVGCIPSKALLHLAGVVTDAEDLARHGIELGSPRFHPERIRAFKNDVVGKLAGGLGDLAKRRQVQVVRGSARFAGPHLLEVQDEERTRTLSFEQAIVAAGSRPVEIPGIPYDDPRVMDSSGALEIEEIPERLLVIGGGIIGLELAAVYDALGTEITVVELLPQLMTGTDPDLVKPLARRITRRYAAIHLGVRVEKIEARDDGLLARFAGDSAPEPALFDRVLVAVGRRPNGDQIAAERAGLDVNEKGFLAADDRQRTHVSHVFAIGDVARAPLLAHKASHEGRVAAEVIAGLPAAFDPRAIPSVAYTDPEVAWAGLTESEAREKGVAVRKAVFPWSASGRALSMGRPEGVTKLLFSEEDGRLVGAGITGRHAGEILAEAVHAMEMGADAEDLALTIHAHPTLSETLGFAAEIAHGSITDLYLPKRGRGLS